MKTKCLAVGLILMMLLLVSCKDVSGHESDKYGFASNHLGTFADSPDGKGIYLFPQLGGMDNLLYYWDMEAQEYTVLCGKADCEHNTTGCNAYFPMVINSTLQVYKDRLYVWGRGERGRAVLYQVDLDGSNRKEVRSLDDTFGTPEHSILCDDMCYVIVHAGQMANGMSIQELYSFSLAGDQSPELIFKSDTEGGWTDYSFWDFFVHGSEIYFRLR